MTNQYKIKVLGFDSWTGGSKFYKRLVVPLRNRGIQLELLHLGSWGVDKGRAKEEMLDNLLTRDISYYKGKTFLDILDIEKPAAVIFLSTDTFAHRAFNRLCQMRGIPTIHQYHGLMRVLPVEAGRLYKANIVSQTWFVVSRLYKMFRKVWPAYISALWITRARLSEWQRFAQDNFDLAIGRYARDSAEDTKADCCCVYTSADVVHACEKYGYTSDQLMVVGNPDLVQFGFHKDHIGCCLSKSTNKKNDDVMYIDTALILRGSVYSGSSDYLDHLVNTHRILKRQGKNLIVKLHPHHFRTNFPDLLSAQKVELCPNENFVPRLKKCCAAIVEPSSAAIIPALMGLPLFLAKFGKLRGQKYGEILIEYPRSRELLETENFNDMLEEEISKFDQVRCEEWIVENAGPQPPELMADRVSEVIKSLIEEKQKHSFRNIIK